MKKLVFIIVALFLLLSNTSAQEKESYQQIFPLVAKDYNPEPCRSKAGAALGYTLTDAAFEALCLNSFYNYGIDWEPRYQGEQYYMYWCPGWRYRERMLEKFNSNSTAKMFYVNEWGVKGQCDTTPEEYIGDLVWLRQNFPEMRLIIGNASGHDSQGFHTHLRRYLDLIEDSPEVTWNDIYGIAIHDYTLNNPEMPIERLRVVLAAYGLQYKPIYISEYAVYSPGLVKRYLEYYESQGDIAGYFYYAPCNPNDNWTLVVRDVWPDGTPWPKQDCSYDELTPLGQAFSDTLRQPTILGDEIENDRQRSSSFYP